MNTSSKHTYITIGLKVYGKRKMDNKKKAYDRLVDVQLLHQRLLELAQMNQELTQYMIPLVEKKQVDPTLAQYIYDIKCKELEVHKLFTKLIESEYQRGGEMFG